MDLQVGTLASSWMFCETGSFHTFSLLFLWGRKVSCLDSRVLRLDLNVLCLGLNVLYFDPRVLCLGLNVSYFGRKVSCFDPKVLCLGRKVSCFDPKVSCLGRKVCCFEGKSYRFYIKRRCLYKIDSGVPSEKSDLRK
jgi:hypothetical protein